MARGEVQEGSEEKVPDVRFSLQWKEGKTALMAHAEESTWMRVCVCKVVCVRVCKVVCVCVCVCVRVCV